MRPPARHALLAHPASPKQQLPLTSQLTLYMSSSPVVALWEGLPDAALARASGGLFFTGLYPAHTCPGAARAPVSPGAGAEIKWDRHSLRLLTQCPAAHLVDHGKAHTRSIRQILGKVLESDRVCT